MLEMTDKEKLIYKRAGEGEKGEKAVLARREYLANYYEIERRFFSEKTAERFTPKTNN